MKKNSQKVIVILSGGLDSTTTLYKMIEDNGIENIVAISFNYGQRHNKELEMAVKTCQKLAVKHDIIDITSITKFISDSSLTSDKPVPEGHYQDENMKQTVVPSRNTIMAAIANGYAVNIEFDAIALGVHTGDHFIYPDCRPQFIRKLNELFAINNFRKIKVITPFLLYNKAYIIKEGLKLGVDYSLTWTCYNGRKKACGKCGSCVERLEAFKRNNTQDPIQYEQ